MSPDEKHKRFCKLSWEILRLKYWYYQMNETVVPDHEYDALEREYEGLATELGLEPTASHMVGFNESRPCCQLVVTRERGKSLADAKKTKVDAKAP